jgi:hypothetical protein
MTGQVQCKWVVKSVQLRTLRKLLIATEKLNVQLQAMAQNQRETETAPQPARAALYLVK